MFEKLNKQSAIAIAIVVILGIFAIVGTVIFLKDKGNTEATEIASENSLNGETVEQQNEENNQQNSTDVTSENNEQTQSSEANNSQANDRANNNQVNSTTNNNQRQNNNSVTNNSESLTTGTTVTGGENRTAENGTPQENTVSNSTGVDSIQGATITRVTEGNLVKVTDDRNVAWSPMDFEVQSASAKIDGEKSKVTIEKKAETKTGSNIVSQGEEIEYTLVATNNSAEDLKGIEVADNIPEKTTYVENSATENANIVTENDRVIGLKWYVDISAGESVQLKFKVIVNEDATGTISNVALTNGNTPSEEIKTAIIEAEKHAKIEGKDGKIAQIGDKITYTITVKNTGDVDGTTTVKDKDLAEILKDNKATMVGNVSIYKGINIVQNDKTAEDLENGITNIEVPAQGEARVEFTIQVNQINDEKPISNIALIGDDEKQTNTETIDTVNITGTKQSTPEQVVKENEEITYTIELSNSGSVEGETIIKDPLSEYVEFQTGSMKINGVPTWDTQETLEKGITIKVPVGEKTASISFKVKVKYLEKEKVQIKNIAYIGDKDQTNEVTNEAEKTKVSLTVIKTWNDNDIQSLRRPEKITFTLVKNEQETDFKKEVESAKIEDKTQTIEFEDLNKYDENGNIIKYGIIETGLNEFYKSNISGTEADSFGNSTVNVENQFTIPENNTTNVEVTKIWEDNTNKAKKRTEKVTLTVSGNNNNNTQDVTLSLDNKKENDNTWVKSVEMPKYDENGQEIVYNASENEVPQFYEKEENGLTVTNTFVGSDETISITINKKWNDNKIQEAHRPDSIGFTISDGKDFSKVVTLGKENNASVTVDGLRKYDENADEINYTVTENTTGLEFYKTSQTYESKDGKSKIFNFENTFTIPENEKEKQITLVKKWEDNENKAKKRPESVEFTVSGNPKTQDPFKVSLTQEDKKDESTWQKTITVPKYTSDGILIDYSADEKETGSIFYKNIDDNLNDLIVTNKFEVPTGNERKIKIEKKWIDNDASKRPNSIKVAIKGGDKVYNIGINSEDGWQKSIDVKNYDENGDRIEYEVSEEYESKFYNQVSIVQPSKENNDTATITNKFSVPDEKITVDVIKKWDDKTENQKQKRPETIDFTLVKGNIATEKSTTMNVDKNTQSQNAESFTNLPRYDENGDEINYTVQESFKSKFYQLKENGINIIKDSESGNVRVEFTNEFKLPIDNQKNIILKKVWEDNGNKAQKRPESIDLELNGTTYTLNKVNGNEWTKTIENQPIYDENGDEISYTVTESEVPNFYEIKGEIIQPTEENKYTATVTNEFKKPTEKKDITVTKIWDDNKDEHQEIEAKIIGIAKGEIVDTGIENVKLNKDNNWSMKVEVPVYDENADQIEYSVREVNVPDGYIVSYDNLQIINRLPSMEVTKKVISVNGEEVQEGTVPEVKEGDVIGYKITVENTSNVKLTNVTVTDDRLISLLPDGADDENSLTNKVGKIDVLGEKGSDTSKQEFTVYYKIKAEDTNIAGREIANVAKATGNYKDSNENNKTAQAEDTENIKTKAIDGISIVKQQFVNNSQIATPNGTVVKENDKINYKITVKNTGNTVLTDVNVSDIMTNQSGNLIINDADKTIGTLNPGETREINAQYELKRADFEQTSKTITNTAIVNAKNPNEEALDPKESSVNVTTTAGKAEMKVQKSSTITKASENKHTGVAEHGDTIKYSIKVSNKGNLSGTITVKDKVPEGTTLLRTGTNLTNTELDQLASESGLSKDITLAANTSTTIEFTVKVTGTPGSTITNTATYKDDENDNTPAKDPTEYSVEKEVKLTKNSETTTTTNSNIVLVMDVSGSMKTNDRLKSSKEAAKKLIQSVDFASGGQIGIVTFSSNDRYDNAQYLKVSRNKKYATNKTEAEKLEQKVEELYADGGTRIADGLAKAQDMIVEMKNAKPENKNIVIVLSDGVFNQKPDYPDYYGGMWNYSCNQGDCLENTGHETVSRVTANAQALKTCSAKPTVYSIAIVSNSNENPGNTNIMTEIIPSSTSNYIKATDGYESIINAFKKVETEISGDGGKNVLSSEGMIELADIKAGTTVKIKVNGTEITNISAHLKIKSGKTYVDLSTFEANAKIEIEYTAN